MNFLYTSRLSKVRETDRQTDAFGNYATPLHRWLKWCDFKLGCAIVEALSSSHIVINWTSLT